MVMVTMALGGRVARKPSFEFSAVALKTLDPIVVFRFKYRILLRIIGVW